MTVEYRFIARKNGKVTAAAFAAEAGTELTGGFTFRTGGADDVRMIDAEAELRMADQHGAERLPLEVHRGVRGRRADSAELYDT
jgi:hypothetical protein